MSTVKANTIEPASGGTVTITGAALTTPALGTAASGTLTNCTGLPASTGLSGTTLASSVVNASLNAITPTGGTLAITGSTVLTGNVGIGTAPSPFIGAVRLVVGSAATPAASGAVTVYSGNASYGGVYFADGLEGDQLTRGAIEYAHDVDELTLYTGATARWDVNASGHLLPVTDNTYNHGSGSYAIKQIYSNNSVIVTSDARLKTARAYTAKERAVARRCRDLGIVYQWNDSISKKGADKARLHFGTTVQSVIAAFTAEGLDPMRYGVVCYDEWGAEVIKHPAVEAREATLAVPEVWEEVEVDVTIRINGEDRPAKRTVLQLVQTAVPAQPAVQAREAWTETVREAGNRYSLRLDQLAFFIATAGAGA